MKTAKLKEIQTQSKQFKTVCQYGMGAEGSILKEYFSDANFKTSCKPELMIIFSPSSLHPSNSSLYSKIFIFPPSVF